MQPLSTFSTLKNRFVLGHDSAGVKWSKESKPGAVVAVCLSCIASAKQGATTFTVMDSRGPQQPPTPILAPPTPATRVPTGWRNVSSKRADSGGNGPKNARLSP